MQSYHYSAEMSLPKEYIPSIILSTDKNFINKFCLDVLVIGTLIIWETLTPERQMEKVSRTTPSTELRRIGLDVNTVLIELWLTFLYQRRSICSDLAD